VGSINIDVRLLSWPLLSFATDAFLRRLEGYKRLLLGSTEMELVIFDSCFFFLAREQAFDKKSWARFLCSLAFMPWGRGMI